jgi:hypothetical protein
MRIKNLIEAPVEELKNEVASNVWQSEIINFNVLSKLGLFVCRKAIRQEIIEKYLHLYLYGLNSGNLHKDKFHLTEVKIPKENELRGIIKELDFINLVSLFFDGNVGSDVIRVVKKDADNSEPVFLHQDSCYQVGSLDRYSIFIALTECSDYNGGLILYPGTHNFGYLGDAGTIRSDILPTGYPYIQPALSTGDVLIMNSSIWHESSKYLNGNSRVYLEVHIQSIDEANTDIEICGVRKSQYRINLNGVSNNFEDQIFKSSRTQKLRELSRK